MNAFYLPWDAQSRPPLLEMTLKIMKSTNYWRHRVFPTHLPGLSRVDDSVLVPSAPETCLASPEQGSAYLPRNCFLSRPVLFNRNTGLASKFIPLHLTEKPKWNELLGQHNIMQATFIIINSLVPTFKKVKRASNVNFNNTFYVAHYVHSMTGPRCNQDKNDWWAITFYFSTKSLKLVYILYSGTSQ